MINEQISQLTKILDTINKIDCSSLNEEEQTNLNEANDKIINIYESLLTKRYESKMYYDELEVI